MNGEWVEMPPCLADVLADNVEAADELTVRNERETTGYIFTPATIARFWPGYLGPAQYLTITNGHAYAVPYDPEKHRSHRDPSEVIASLWDRVCEALTAEDISIRENGPAEKALYDACLLAIEEGQK